MKINTNCSISIIIPSYNQGNFINQTINSLLDQQYPDLEIIIFDGGSTDNTLDVLESYQNNIQWFSEKDNGQSDALNKGLHLAKGDIIGYLNSDDYLLPGSLQTISNTFLRTNALWVSGDAIIVDENSRQIQRSVRFYKNLLRKLPFKSFFYITNYLIQPSTFWNRRALDLVGFFDENLHYCMDYEYWLRLLKNEQPTLINDPLSAFRIHSKSKGGMHYREQIDEELKMLNQYTDSKFLKLLHKAHSSIIIIFYRFLKEYKFKIKSNKTLPIDS